MGAQPKWKRASRVRLVVRTPGFHSGYAGSNPARDAINPKSPERSRLATQTGRNDWAAPEPVTGTFVLLLDVAKWSKASDCKSDGKCPRQFEPDRRVQCFVR